MKTEPFALDLPHELTQQELIAKGAELSRVLDEKEHIEAEKKAAVSGFKARFEEKNQVVRRVSECIRTGKEMRPFECFERMNMHERLIETVKSDGLVVVSSRPMTPDEHQLHLDEVINNMERQAKKQKRDDASAIEAAGEVVKAANSGGVREHLALPADTTAPANGKPKKKSGAQRVREKKAAAEALKAAKSSKAPKGKVRPKAATKDKSKPKKHRPVLERESFADTSAE
jgi:hypothetical protein